MGYEYITKYDSPNYSKGRPQGKPAFIVIHHWGADGQKFQNVVNYLCRKNGNSSAHYIVESGKVACIVDPENRAWHAGTGGNPRGIGIECRPECTQGDLETVAELIADLRKTYGNLPLYPHKKFMATACPGRYEAKLGWLDQSAQQILKTNQKPKETKMQPTNEKVPVYRMYNPKNGQHLWTSDTNETAALKKQGWKEEGVAFYAYKAKKV